MAITNSDHALRALNKFNKSYTSPDKFLSSQQEKLGLGAAQETARGLRTAIADTTRVLERVAPSVMGRTAGSLVTSAQADRQIANERTPIASQLGKFQGLYSDAVSDVDMINRQASQAAEAQMQGQSDRQSYLQNLYSTLFAREQDARANRLAREQLELQKQAAARAGSGGGGGFDLSGLFGGGDVSANNKTKTTSAPKIPASLQNLFNAVFIKSDGTKWDDRSLVSDYNATKISAGYGNARDKKKLELYHRVRPDLFGSAVSGASLANNPTF